MNDTEKQDTGKNLQDALNAKSDLISVTAHQLRTSLTAAKWILQMLLDKDTGNINTEQEDYLRKLFASNERMIALVTDMLALNHADDPIAVTGKQQIDIEKLLTEILFEFSGETRKKNITLSIQKSSSGPFSVEGDTGMVRVVFESVIENAIKYSNADGAVLISIEAKEDSAVCVAVHNTGLSIAESDKPHIFEKFFRTQEAKDREDFGSGLGLFIAHSMLSQHQGSLSFESSPENGTTFFITLPRS